MLVDRRRLLTVSATALLVSSGANAWPDRFVRIVVPFAAGTGIDSVARLVSDRLSEVWGLRVGVENRPGSGGNIGSEAVSRSVPDGHTILCHGAGLPLNRYLFSRLAYDPVGDFAPVTLLGTFPNVLAVPNSSPARSVQEFIAYAKDNKGKLTCAISSGVGTTQHLSGELFKRTAGIDMILVPYNNASFMNDLISGRVDAMFSTAQAVQEQMRAGTIRGLAVTSARRFASIPDLPTVAESGLPGFDVSSWYGLFVPSKTPGDIVSAISRDTSRALADTKVGTKLERLGLIVITSTPSEFAALVKAEMAKYGPLIQELGIRIE
jgi:tripartite-type tricarboxylate transporter receptor subunit TctC